MQPRVVDALGIGRGVVIAGLPAAYRLLVRRAR